MAGPRPAVRFARQIQCAELRALQDLRPQGFGTEHRLGLARRRRRAQPRRHV